MPVQTVDDSFILNEDSNQSGNVLSNDSDSDGNALSVTGNSNPANGTVQMNSNGTFTYTPNANFNGTDSFTYTVSNGNGGSGTATVNLTVNPVNDEPDANADNFSGDENTVFTGNVLSNDNDVDGDPLNAKRC